MPVCTSSVSVPKHSEMNLRKENHSLVWKTWQHLQLLGGELKQGEKVKESLCTTVAVSKLSWDHQLDLLSSTSSMYRIKLTHICCYFWETSWIFSLFCSILHKHAFIFVLALCPCWLNSAFLRWAAYCLHFYLHISFCHSGARFDVAFFCMVWKALHIGNETAWFLSSVLIKCADLAKAEILSHFLEVILVAVISFGVNFK